MIMTCGAPSLALAQMAMTGVLPGAADPARIDRHAIPPSRQLRHPESPPPEKNIVPMAPAGAEKIVFILQGLTVEGMTAYSAADIQNLYAPHLNEEISAATLFDIAAALQKKYTDDGYTLTRVMVPDQDIEAGQARLAVIEGYVAEVEVDSDILPAPVIAEAVREISVMKPLNTIRLERILLILNDLPDLNISAILAGITSAAQNPEPGALRLVLKKNKVDEPRAEISADNYGSVFSGPFQFNARGHLPHIGMNYSDLSLSMAVTSPVQEQRVVSVSYAMPVFGNSGARLEVLGITGLTRPGASLADLEIKGRSQTLAAGLTYPVIKQRGESWDIEARLETKNSQTDILGDALYDDRLRIIEAGTNYSFSDRYDGYNAFDFRISQGLDILGARETGSEYLSREDGHSDFTKWSAFAGRLQALPRNFQLYAMTSAQYSNKPLLSSEEFGFGGAQSGRGYDPSEITGDKGISGTLELRHNIQKNIAGYDFFLQPYVFYDIGKIWNTDQGASDHVSAASAGFGINFALEKTIEGAFCVAVPLSKSTDNPPKYTDEDGVRVLFSLTRRF